MTGLFDQYARAPGVFDEWFDDQGQPRAPFADVVRAWTALSPEQFARAQAIAEKSLLQQGVTFSVYADRRGTEKIFPFCLLPRIIAAAEWRTLEAGLIQRIRALELFLADVYGPRRILADGRIPATIIDGARQYLSQVRDIAPPGGVRVAIAGIDLVRDEKGVFRVLEDNLRTPSGVSYVLANRLVSKAAAAKTFDLGGVRRVDIYPTRLAETLRSLAPPSAAGLAEEEVTAVVLTPGPYNSAYYEHSFLARTMGVELVEPGDLFVNDDRLWLRTTRGPQAVHVVYRRVDEAFLDPDVFRPDSLLGVRGIFRAWAKGNVTLVNAPGNGVADDKGVYPFVPDMIRYYLGEEPLLAQVPTYSCARADDCAYVLAHLDELVVKTVDESGGYGMLMGPQSTATERETFAERIRADPRRYIAQPLVELSCCPTWDPVRREIGPRRVDLRPYILTGRNGTWVLPGGLTRTALVERSYVVNSSQGGGSKDTWVEREES